MDCDCTTVTFTLSELTESGAPLLGGLAFKVPVDGLTWEEVDPPSRSEKGTALVEEFLRDYPAAEKEAMRAECEEKQRIARRLRDYRIDGRLIADGTLVSFSEIISPPAPTRDRFFVDSFEYNGVKYLVNDLYCPVPGCDCVEVYLCFLALTPVGGQPNHAEANSEFLAKIDRGGRVRIAECTSCPREQADAVLAAWRKQYGDDFEEFWWRYAKIKEIARRTPRSPPRSANVPDRGRGRPSPWPLEMQPEALATAPPRAGRNDPCPCGSGKKFKKCCGTARP
jgi:hypothetical protein